LDPTDLSKVLEKLFVPNYRPWKFFQSGFRAQQSTDSALLKVYNEMLLSFDSRASTIFVLLDIFLLVFDNVE